MVKQMSKIKELTGNDKNFLACFNARLTNKICIVLIFKQYLINDYRKALIYNAIIKIKSIPCIRNFHSR